MSQRMPVLFRLQTRFEGSAASLSFHPTFDGSTAAQRNGRSGFSYLSTVAAVAVLFASIVLGACSGGNSTPKAVAPAITMNPANATVTAGTAAQFTAAASGQPAPTVQWQLSTNGGATFANVAGATATMLSVVGTTVASSGSQYRAVFTNASGMATTTAATLTVNAANNTAPTITTNPTNLSVTAGAMATFTAVASGSPTPTVQWQVSTGGGAFANLAGATSTTLTITGTTVAMSGNKYQAVFTNAAGSATTSAATLTVNAASTAPTITTNPTNLSVTAGTTATFTAAASGSPTPTVQWQVSTGGGAFANLAGATSTTLTITGTTVAMSGNKYQAVFTNTSGSATTTAATLTVTAAAAKSGTVMGGVVPVTGSTIQLYAVGASGDGSASTPLLTGAAVKTDSSGNFSLPAFVCPTPDTLVYLTATGGNPGLAAGTNNSALVMMTALGACSTVTPATQIWVNERTTIASIFSLALYMTSTTSIGSGGSDATAFATAFATVNEFVNITDGTVPGPALPAGMDASPETINSLSNLISFCVESAGGVAGDGSACGNLFAATTPPGPANVKANSSAHSEESAHPDGVVTAAVDTAIAAKDVADDPADDVTGLFNLSTGGSQSAPGSGGVWMPPLPVPPVTWTPTINIVSSGALTVLTATAGSPGVVVVPFSTQGTGAFAVEADNAETSGISSITVSTSTNGNALPIGITICQTNPSTGQCLASPGATLTIAPFAPGSLTFSVFVTAAAAVPNDPVANRIYVLFKNASGAVEGSVSVAVVTD
jgi:hypothetical protein